MSSDIKSNLTNADTWLRIVFIVLFLLLVQLIGWVLLAVVVVQFVLVLFSGEKNKQLASFGGRLGTYLKQIVSYMSFASDAKPFPFSDFPAEDSVE